MKIWQSLIYNGIFMMGIFFILASFGALISFQLIPFSMFLITGIITILLSIIVESYFKENSTEKKSLEKYDLI